MKCAIPILTALTISISSPSSWATTSELNPITYQSVEVGDVSVFYREAGPKDANTILLLHGFPSSSHMFRDLIPQLSKKYRVIAPDYPGFGQSSVPDASAYDYVQGSRTKPLQFFVTVQFPCQNESQPHLTLVVLSEKRSAHDVCPLMTVLFGSRALGILNLPAIAM